MVWAAVLYSLGFIVTLLGRITSRKYVASQVHPMIQTLFPKNDAVFQDDNAPNRTDGTLSHCLKSMKVNFQHLPWPPQSPAFSITEQL
jgi:hypothetical protein